MQKDRMIEILEKARQKIHDGWCQGPMAINSRGHALSPDSPHACAWCALGSLFAVTKNWWEQIEALQQLDRYVRGAGLTTHGVVAVNEDSKTTRLKMLDIFDNAIEMVKREYQHESY